MKISGMRMRADEWRGIEALLSAGGRPKPDDLLKALAGGGTIPPRAQAYLASFVKPTPKGRGRKATPEGEYPISYELKRKFLRDLHECRLMLEVREAATGLKGADGLGRAIQTVATRHRMHIPTLRRYYLAACKKWPDEPNGPHEI
jgi:hypothetical protein